MYATTYIPFQNTKKLSVHTQVLLASDRILAHPKPSPFRGKKGMFVEPCIMTLWVIFVFVLCSRVLSLLDALVCLIE